MKTFFCAVIVGVLLIAGGMVYDSCIKDFSEEMLKVCDNLEKKIHLQDDSGSTEEIQQYLDEKKTLLSSIINHSSLSEIETCITELDGYLRSKNYKEARVRCGKLKLLVERLPMEYGVSLQNIL